ncbi:MAG TPA: aspartyl protease family protein [Rhizomicrobium sp.]|nr:aspartyl protease family protein [Rhizomicrobium sp.]
MISRLLVAAAAAVLLCSSARADDDCHMTTYGTSTMAQLPGETSEFLPVEIGGQQKLLLIDTGGAITMIKTSLVRELGLKPSDSGVELFDVTGRKSNLFVYAPLNIVDVKLNQIPFMLATPYIEGLGGSRVAGLLGANFMRNFDISIDFGAHTFAMFSQKHCDGKVVYWPERPIVVIPFELRGDQIILTVTLDGHDFKALLDTGASGTTLERSRAEGNFDIVLGSADTPRGGDFDEKRDSFWKHHFKSLSFGGIEVSNPEIDIIPDLMSTNSDSFSTGSMLDRKYNNQEQPPMLLGMNVLRHLHLYIAYKERKLYVTPGGTPPPGYAPLPPLPPAPVPKDDTDEAQGPNH